MPSETDVLQTPETDAKPASSPAEDEQTIPEGKEKEVKPARKPGVLGAPRKDGFPIGTKTKKDPLPSVPSPPYKRYWSEAPNFKQKPTALLTWLTECPSWVKDRTLWYVNREHPILKPVEVDDQSGKRLEYKYIDKIPGNEPIESVMRLQDKYGAGDYKLTLKDDENQLMAECWVRESFRDFKSHPPSDRRIDDPEKNLDMDDPANRSYIAYLRANGKLPEQTKGATAMAEASAVQQVTGLLGEVVRDSMKRPREDSSGAAEALKVVASAAVTGQEIIRDSIRDSMKRSDEMKTAAPDPLDTFTKVASIIKESRSDSNGGSGMVGQFMEMFKITLGVQNERIAFAEKVAMEAKTQSNNPTTSGDGGGGGGTGSGFIGMARQLNELKEVLGGGDSGGPWYKDPSALTAVLQGAGMVLGNAVALYQTHVRSQEVAKGIAVPPSNMPQPVTDVTQPNPNTSIASAEEEEEGQMEYVAFLRAITKPFLNHFDMDADADAFKGALFAEWLIDGYGRSTYDNIKAAGKDALIMALSSFEPIAKEIRGKEVLVKKFVDEFMSMEEIKRKEEEEEEEDQGSQGADIRA